MLEFSDEEIKNYKENDIFFKILFNQKDEVVRLINDEFKTNFKKDEIEKYETEYISKRINSKNAIAVYKIKDKNIFILIEHQREVDYFLANKIAYHQLIIMNSVFAESDCSKELKIPQIWPIVLYTGDKKWDAPKELEKRPLLNDIIVTQIEDIE